MSDEKTATFMITEGLGWAKEPRFYVHMRRQKFKPGILFGRTVTEWKEVESFSTLEAAEKYVKDYLDIERSRNNPKIVGYY